MILAEIAYIATSVSGFAVTASLIYVGIQTRQNVRHTRALIHQGTAARTTSLLLSHMTAEAVTAWIEGNGGSATPELVTRRQFYHHCGSVMIAMEDYFAQHEAGLFSDEQFARASVTFRERLKEPGLRGFWQNQRKMMINAAPHYCRFIDALCDSEPVTFGDLV
jgi:hypothetical protein